jgi:hypothetical protein
MVFAALGAAAFCRLARLAPRTSTGGADIEQDPACA